MNCEDTIEPVVRCSEPSRQMPTTDREQCNRRRHRSICAADSTADRTTFTVLHSYRLTTDNTLTVGACSLPKSPVGVGVRSRRSTLASSATPLLFVVLLLAVMRGTECRVSVSSLIISPMSGTEERELLRAVGTAAVFTCEVVFTPYPDDDERLLQRQRHPASVSLEWFDKNDVRIQPQNYQGTRLLYTDTVHSDESSIIKKLYIPSIHNKHAGLYTCAVTEDDVRINETDFTLLLFRDMVFETSPDVIETAEHKSVILPCVIHGQPEPVVSWRHGTKKIKPGGRITQLANGLIINNVTSTDRGLYYCQGHVPSHGQFKEKAIELILLAGPWYGNHQSVNVFGVLGRPLVVSCIATGSQPIVYEFFKDGNSVDQSDGRITLDSESGLMNISSLNAKDAGRYLCMARNSIDKATAERTVKVHNGPKVYEFDSVIESRGMTATLMCLSDGQPDPRITFYRVTNASQSRAPWRRGPYISGSTYEQGRILVRELMPGCAELFIIDVTVEDTGTYVCESVNYIGVDRRFASIKIGYQPEFETNKINSIYVWPGQKTPVNITCSVDAVPQPTVRWRHKHQWLLDDSNGRDWWSHVYRIHSINNYTSVLEVIMPSSAMPIVSTDYDPRDNIDIDWIYGDYICRATNFFGAEDSVTELVRANVPSKPRSVTVRRRHQRYIELDVEPPYFNGGVNVTGYQVQNDVNISQFSLGENIRLNGLMPSTVYMLSVAAVNDVGVGRSFVIIVVTADLRPPTFVKIKSAIADTTTDHDYVVTWYQPDDGGMPIRRYRVQYRQIQPNGPKLRQHKAISAWNSTLVTVDDESSEFPPSALSYRLTTLLPQTYYELHVSAQNDLDWSPPPSTAVSSSAFILLTNKSPPT